MNIAVLKRIGLTESEIKVYFALMKLGLSSTGPIIKESTINHSKIYFVLKKLEDKGLASHVIKSNTTYYQSSDPANFLEYIQSKIDVPTFFFFSDDIAWVKENIKVENNSYYIDWNS